MAVLDGARYVRAPFSPGFAQFPESRPFAALDGSERSEWLADAHLEEDRRWIEVGFDEPRDVSTIEVLPAGGRKTATIGVEVDGHFHPVKPGWNRIELGLRDVDSLRLLMVSDLRRDDVSQGNGLAELRVPGLEVSESLRPPTLIEAALRGQDIGDASLTYLFSRTTGDRPHRRETGRRPVRTVEPDDREDPDAVRIRDAEDGELELSRVFHPPAARSYALDAWTSTDPDAADSEIDRLAGMSGDVEFRSSGRFQGLARHRASSAFDGDPDRAWVADRLYGSTPYVEWETPLPVSLRSLRVIPSDLPAGRPTIVRVRTPAGSSSRLRVGPTGGLALPRTFTAQRFRLEVLEAEQPAGNHGETPATVAIADLEGVGVPRAPAPSSASLAGRCGDASVRVADRDVALRVRGTVAALEAGLPLRAAACAKGLALEASEQRLTTEAGVVRVDHVRLRSEAPDGIGIDRGGGAVLDPGETGRGSHEGVRVRVDGPAWLVLGETYNAAWRASCDGRDLGEPVVVDGYANGWHPPVDCREVDLSFAPQRAVTAGYAVSALACPALLGLLLVGGTRRRRRPAAPDRDAEPEWNPAPDNAEPWPWRRAAAGRAGRGGGVRLPVRAARRAPDRTGSGPGAVARRGRARPRGGGRFPAGRGGPGGLRAVSRRRSRRLQLRLRPGHPGRPLGGGGRLRAAVPRPGAGSRD